MFKRLFCLVVIFILPAIVFALEEQITVTTYYPSPYGSYAELRSKKMVIGATYIKESTLPTSSVADSNLIVEGNVGIGITAPVAKLEVNGAAIIQGNAVINNGANIMNGLQTDQLRVMSTVQFPFPPPGPVGSSILCVKNGGFIGTCNPTINGGTNTFTCICN
ncbi:MAG: hypothetical protein MUF05_01540 [Candidatus Omnitrophica bacterium]|jgi:hypothetical protein|nr:hypothetical protein [Candidatus Omnitrophota bacterium]